MSERGIGGLGVVELIRLAAYLHCGGDDRMARALADAAVKEVAGGLSMRAVARHHDVDPRHLVREAEKVRRLLTDGLKFCCERVDN